MRVLIVHAHHEPTSFNSAMTRHALETLAGAGHEVVLSDLYAMGFDPVSDRRNFTTIADAARLRQQDEEALASASGGFAPELQSEMDKVAWCDAMIFQFPIWWLGLPAILKGSGSTACSPWGEPMAAGGISTLAGLSANAPCARSRSAGRRRFIPTPAPMRRSIRSSFQSIAAYSHSPASPSSSLSSSMGRTGSTRKNACAIWPVIATACSI